SDMWIVADDENGAKLHTLIEGLGFAVSHSAIVKDDPSEIRALIAHICDEDLANAIMTTNNTEITPHNQSYKTINALLEKRLDGFGEAFRRLSWDEIGPRAILSRAVCGTHRGRVVAALPGSPKALALAVERILAP